MTQPFRLQAILDLRQRERDRFAAAVTDARAQHACCLDVQTRVGLARNELMDELRSLNESAGWTVSQVVDRRQHLEQLRYEFEDAARVVADAKTQLSLRMEELLKAEQAFRGLERLAEKHAQAEDLRAAKRSNAEMDDATMSRWCRAEL